MWVLVRFVRFEFGSIPISNSEPYRAALSRSKRHASDYVAFDESGRVSLAFIRLRYTTSQAVIHDGAGNIDAEFDREADVVTADVFSHLHRVFRQ